MSAPSTSDQPGPDGLELGPLLATGLVGGEGVGLLGELLDAGERRGEDHAGVVAKLVGKAPPLGQLGTEVGRLVAHDQRDAGVAQRVEARADRQLCRSPVGGQAVGVDAELGGQVELTAASGELEHVARAVDRLERRTLVALDQPGDAMIEHLVADARRDHVDELLAVQQEAEVGVVEDARGAGGAEGGAGDDDRLLRRRGPGLGATGVVPA